MFWNSPDDSGYYSREDSSGFWKLSSFSEFFFMRDWKLFFSRRFPPTHSVNSQKESNGKCAVLLIFHFNSVVLKIIDNRKLFLFVCSLKLLFHNPTRLNFFQISLKSYKKKQCFPILSIVSMAKFDFLVFDFIPRFPSFVFLRSLHE
jgi:hypothetical protein